MKLPVTIQKMLLFFRKIYDGKKKLTLYILLLSLHTQAQVSKTYGFRQYLYGGAMQMNNDAEDKPVNEMPKPSVSTRYFIFAEIEKTKSVHLQQLWIDKQLYNFTIDTVRQFPFTVPSSGRDGSLSNDTLVKSSTGYVIQLKDPAPVKRQAIPKSTGKLIKKNALVLIYQYKGRVRQKFIRQLRQLNPFYNP